MALTNVPLGDITEAHLGRLIEGQAAEALTIEYKRDTYGRNDQAKAEFLADVSSFANARGGDLLIGLDAPGGIPRAVVPFAGDGDAERLRLEQMARSGLEPRVSNLETRAIPVVGGSVLILRVPRSYNGPHRVIFAGRNRFWARSSAGKYEPNVDELRALFALAPDLADRMRAFRFARVAAIAAHDTPVPLQDNWSLVLHVVPFSHFDLRPSLSLSAVADHALYILPIGATHPDNRRFNFDGFLTLSYADQLGRQRAYVQVFRTGAIEAVANLREWSDGHIDIKELDDRIIHHTRIYATLLRECGAAPPYMVMASLVGVEGKLLGKNDRSWGTRGHLLDRDQLHLGEVVLEEAPDGNPNCGMALRPMLDQLANTAGHEASFSFDDSGNCTVRTP